MVNNMPGSSSSEPKRSRDLANLNKVMTFGLFSSAALMLNVLQANADAATPSGPIVIIGSGGKTGKLTIQMLSKMGIAVRPTNREGKPNKAFANLASVESMAAADVTKIATLEGALVGASAVIFAASASGKGGNGKQVDNQGVVNVAAECIRLKVPKLVVISSGAVTKPNSLGFKLTNMFAGGIMDEKLAGENGLRKLYSECGDSSLSYAIIRPGGLQDGPSIGSARVELNQGDTISGEINRADVADCAVAAALSKSIPSAVTFELYDADNRGPLESIYPDKSGYERSGKELGGDYDLLFKGLKNGHIV